MKFIVYLTLCTANGKIYIGVHKTNPDIFDGYLGCGVYIKSPISYKKSKTPFQYAVNKYGVDKFKRITLGVFDTKEEAFNLERQLVNEEFLKRKDTYNVKEGGEGGCAPSRIVKVYMYDLKGNFVKEFESAFECSCFFNKNAKNGSAVLKAIRLGHTLHGYQFAREKLPYMKQYTPSKGSRNNKKAIARLDENGIVETFDSTLAAVKSGYKNVSKALKFGIKCKGFYFKYLED